MREPKILNKIFRNSLGYAVAVGAVALATWLKLLAQPNIIPTDVPILYLVAIVPIAIFFGLGPSLLVCVLSFLAYDYYFIPPIHQITYSADAGPILAIFLIVGVLFSYLTSNLRRQNQVANKEIAARKQSEEELIRYRDHLEELVKERTFELEKTNSELKTEIIEHKKDEEALRQSEERWATTLASIGDGVIATDMLGRVTFMNTVAQDLTGWKTGEANQKPIAEVFNIVNETTRQKAENPVDKVLQLGIICSLANHTILMQKDGAEISIDDSGAPIKDAQDVTTGVVLVFRDITERRKAEIMLRRVEERNRLLADILEHASQPFGIGLPDGSLGIVNKAFCDLTGYTAEELKTMDWAKVLTPPEYLSMEEEKLAELVRTGQPVRYQKEYIRKDKSRVPIELLVHLMRNAEGQAEYYYSFLTDISERKRAEEEKQTTLNRFYTILSKMPLGILLVNKDGLTEFANQTFCDMFDLKQSPEEVRNLAANEVINKIQNVYENSEMAVARITEIVNRGEPVKDEEIPLQAGRVVLRDFVPIWLGENRYGRLWIHRDITERKKMEDALKDSEAKANALIKYAPTAIYELDYRIPRIISVNEAVSSMSGYTREELLSMNPTDLLDEDSKNRFAERMKSTLAGRKIDEIVDFRIKKKDGSFMYVTLNVSLSQEKPFTALVIAHDITERKRAEIEISRLSQQRQLALDAAHMGWWQYDPATQIATNDEGYQRIFGVSGSQRPNEEILKRLHPDDLPRVWASVEAALNPANPQPYSVEYRIFLNDGAVRWIEAHGIATFEGEGSARRATSLIGTVADITERVQADEKLKDSQKQLLDIIDGAPNSIFVKDLQGRFITINAQLEKLLGKTREEIKGKTDYDIISRDQAANYLDNDRRITENDKPEQLEEEADLADGRHHYFLANKFPLHDIHGKTYAVASVSTDLTEFKQAEKAVRESEEKFSKIFHSSPIGMVMTHLPEGRCVDVNEAYLKMLEYRRDEIIGRDSRDLNMHINPDKRDEVFRLLREQGKVTNIELSFRTKTGRIIELLSSIDRISLQGQEYSLSTNIDITARKRAETEVVHLASFPEYNPMPIVEVSGEGDVIYANPAARLKFPRMIHGQKRKFLTDFINIVRDSETSVAVKDVNIDEYWYEETMAYVASTNTYRLYAREITLRKKFEDELKQRTMDLEASNKELEAFSYSVSHDLRAPLRSITGFSTVLLEDYATVLDNEGKSYLKKISASGELMGQLMDDLLKLSRVARSDLNVEELDLSNMARKIVDELRNDEPKRKVKVTIARNMTANGDKNLLGLVLQNLLGNAWKYSSKTADPRIEMDTVEHNGKRAYFVRDNGVGFDMTYADKLFKPFQRLHRATEFAGTGIGLATVQRIIRRHGGEVWAESKVGEGATFYFTLN